MQVIARLLVYHHNRIQFFGYEVSNVVLAAQQLYLFGLVYGLNAETAAAVLFLLGSACIYFFNQTTRPTLLLWGGIFLTGGGAALLAAGYLWTGGAVILASLETARGGMAFTLNAQSYVTRGAVVFLTPYRVLVARLAYVIPVVGSYANDRPFITGALIKAPFRLEFIIKKALQGDWVGCAVGMSWLFLGDLPLALNDRKFKKYMERFL